LARGTEPLSLIQKSSVPRRSGKRRKKKKKKEGGGEMSMIFRFRIKKATLSLCGIRGKRKKKKKKKKKKRGREPTRNI